MLSRTQQQSIYFCAINSCSLYANRQRRITAHRKQGSTHHTHWGAQDLTGTRLSEGVKPPVDGARGKVGQPSVIMGGRDGAKKQPCMFACEHGVQTTSICIGCIHIPTYSCMTRPLLAVNIALFTTLLAGYMGIARPTCAADPQELGRLQLAEALKVVRVLLALQQRPHPAHRSQHANSDERGGVACMRRAQNGSSALHAWKRGPRCTQRHST